MHEHCGICQWLNFVEKKVFISIVKDRYAQLNKCRIQSVKQSGWYLVLMLTLSADVWNSSCDHWWKCSNIHYLVAWKHMIPNWQLIYTLITVIITCNKSTICMIKRHDWLIQQSNKIVSFYDYWLVILEGFWNLFFCVTFSAAIELIM